ncbi:hypothetical protein [Confluentibacter citreus]|uniref:hypothetical protein n=1 Tax=Confluentibacter citreus TaxID=2007307 RepID=UPI000C28A34F|nr:hypothetical protein [Confluentibacter citreus]
MTDKQLKFLTNFKTDKIAIIGKTSDSEIQELVSDLKSLNLISEKSNSSTLIIIDLISFDKLIELKSLSEFKKWYLDKDKSIYNNFSGSTIGQLNQSDFLKNQNTEIKQIIQPKTNEKQQNAIISFIEKFWWQILIPLVIGIILILIEKGIINIGI